MESFFATLKKEKLYQIPTYRMKREEVKTVIFRYIFGYYNTQRINSFNEGGLPPVALRTSKQIEYVALKWTLRPRKLNSAVGENEHFRRKKWTVAENDCERQLFHDKIVLHVFVNPKVYHALIWKCTSNDS